MKKRMARLVALVAATALAVVGVATAAHVEPLFVAGNPSCGDGLLIQPVASGTYGDITITVNDTAQGQTFDFTSTSLVQSIVVKGGPNANVYTYVAPGVSSDTGLHSPLNAKNGKYYGLSHLCVTDDKKSPPPTDPK